MSSVLELQAQDRVSWVAPFGVQFCDAVTRAPIRMGLEVVIRLQSDPQQQMRAHANSSGILLAHRLPGMAARMAGMGDAEFWRNPPPVRDYQIQVSDRMGRYLPLRFQAALPLRGLCVPDVLRGSPPMSSEIPLYSTPSRPRPGPMALIRSQLRDVELQSESQMQSRLAQTKDSAQAFDPLEFDRFTRVQELTRMMAESVHDVATVQRNLQRSIEGAEDDLIAQGRQARELQRDLLRTRMVEFESISDRLYGVVRQAAKDSGKQVKLDITGGSIEMDRGVLDRMGPAFEHMLRNSVAHGVESAADRVAAGKAPVGTITIHVNQESNDVSVSFSDDGGGLHLDKIRAKAIANFLSKNGIAQNRISADSKGEADPVADNSTEDGRHQNRRVVITVNR